MMTSRYISQGFRSKTFNRLHELSTGKKFFVFDVETWGLSATPENFALGCIYGDGYEFKTSNLDELQTELLSEKFSNCILFAHNAIYDLLTIFGNFITTLDPKAVFNNSTFILCRFHKTTFADSYNILPAKAEKIGELIGHKKGKTPLKFIHGKRGRITSNDFEYCMQDCRLIYKALEDIFTEVGCVRVTLASLSMAYFRRRFLKEPIYYTDTVYNFFDSYYGGRVEAFKIGDTYAQKFDINSMYPYAMKVTKFPDPSKLKEIIKPDIKTLSYYLTYYEGLITCRVRHKDTYLGYLPVKRSGKLIFPTGIFRGCWNFNEFKFALNSGIIEILDIDNIVVAPAIDSPFAEFIDTLYLRRKLSNNDFEKYRLKLLMNSLYGKFAQRRKSKSEYFSKMSSELLGKINGEYKVIPFNSDREDGYIVQDEIRYSYNTIPVFSSYITSAARVHLLKLLLEYQENEPVYCDTDSIAMANDSVPVLVGDALGQFKMESHIITHIYGNKSYEEKDGNLVMKGVKKGSQRISKNTFVTKQMVKPKTALRRKLKAGTFITSTKVIKEEYDKRQVLYDQNTLPLKLNEK